MFRRAPNRDSLSSPAPTLVVILLLSFSFLSMVFKLHPLVQDLRSFLFYWFSPSIPLTFSAKKNLLHFNSRLHNLIDIDQENLALKEKMREISLIEFQHKELLAENNRLREMLDLKKSVSFKTIGATIIARESSNWNHTFTIDKGSVEGIVNRSPVLGIETSEKDPPHVQSGVIGRIHQCGEHSSQVLLLTDPLSSVACSIVRTGEQGLLQGASSNLHLEYLDPTSNVQIGDWVLTSGIGGVFPPGLGVGRVQETGVTPSGFRKAVVQPLVKLNRLREVLVIVP